MENLTKTQFYRLIRKNAKIDWIKVQFESNSVFVEELYIHNEIFDGLFKFELILPFTEVKNIISLVFCFSIGEDSIFAIFRKDSLTYILSK